MYQLTDYHFDLPEELIAKHPEKTRSNSRLMHIRKGAAQRKHLHFSDLASLLRDDDLLVVNNTRVVPARLHARKESGGKVEILLLDYQQGLEEMKQKGKFACRCLLKASKRVKIGTP
ncbi:MAG: S-adenosylmethionine:tRNA ribosyltransferase-isomerase, partial [Desulfobacterales bacterium]|nr:S-adenosylmethionine:tRNA ribosyltransferase-isomerase [Desulfobacterales bacterium]